MELQRGFELLKTRKVGDDGNIDALEEKYGIKLPPKFKLFHQTFEVGPITDSICDAGDAFILDEVKIKNQLHPICFLNSDLKFPFLGFDTIDGCLSKYKEFLDIIPKTFLSFGAALYGAYAVGLIDENEDQIFHIDWEMRQNSFISDNIFDFMKGFSIKTMDESKLMKFRYDFQFQNLYKNWNEDFWRVKDE